VLAPVSCAVTPTFHPLAISGSGESGTLWFQWDLSVVVSLLFLGIFFPAERIGRPQALVPPVIIAFACALALGLYLSIYRFGSSGRMPGAPSIERLLLDGWESTNPTRPADSPDLLTRHQLLRPQPVPGGCSRECRSRHRRSPTSRNPGSPATRRRDPPGPFLVAHCILRHGPPPARTCVCSGSAVIPKISFSSRRTVATSTSSGSVSRASFFVPPKNARKTALRAGVRPRNLRCHKRAGQHRAALAGRNQKPKSVRAARPASLRRKPGSR